MVTSVTQNIQPKAVNYVANENRLFARSSVEREIEKQNKARYENIDDVKLSEFAKNYLEFYDNQAAKFSVEALKDDNVTSIARRDLVAFKLFKLIDQPASSDVVSTDNKITTSEVSQFLDKADFLLNQIGILVPDSEVDLNEYVYFASTLNDIKKDIDSINRSLNFKEFTDIVASNLDSKRIKPFEKVLDAVSRIVDVNDDVERPVVFNAYI